MFSRDTASHHCARFSLMLAFGVLSLQHIQGQSPDAISQYFEGRQVTVKLDMPASQKGVDIYPDRPQPLDTKSYSSRIKQFGTSLRSGDTVTITKVKVKSDNVEFQLAGGGYGTAGDNTDSSVHFTPADKSSHEKELEDQLSRETDDDRRRSLSRELDDVRRDRERQDRRDRARAEDDADRRRDQIAMGREQGGSRFNLRFDRKKSGDALTPEVIETALSQYVSFSPSPGFDAAGRSELPRSYAGPPSPPQPANTGSVQGLRKGLTRGQVDDMFGPPVETQDRKQDDLTVTSCVYRTATATVHAEFVSGVLVQYMVSSR